MYCLKKKCSSPYYEAGSCCSCCCHFKSVPDFYIIIYRKAVRTLVCLWFTSFLPLDPRWKCVCEQKGWGGGSAPTRGLISSFIPLVNESHVTEPKSALGNLKICSFLWGKRVLIILNNYAFNHSISL